MIIYGMNGVIDYRKADFVTVADLIVPNTSRNFPFQPVRNAVCFELKGVQFL